MQVVDSIEFVLILDMIYLCCIVSGIEICIAIIITS